MAEIYGIGNPLIDLIYRVDESDLAALGLSKGIMHLVDEAGRDRILSRMEGRPVQYAPGGDCPNTIINIALLGSRAALSGCIGQDEYGSLYEKRVTQCGVVSDLHRVAGKTGSSIILVSAEGERTMNTYLGTCQLYGPEYIDREMLQASKILYITGYMWDTPEQKAAVTRALELAHSSQTLVAFDLADPFAVGRYKADFLKLLKEHVDIVFANQEEARLLFGHTEIEANLEEFAKRVGIVALKDGPRGSLLALRKERLRVGAFEVKVVDTTGAGDSFAAGFLHGMLLAMSEKRGDAALSAITADHLQEAARIASWIAARVITRAGSQLLPEEVTMVRHELSEGRHRH